MKITVKVKNDDKDNKKVSPDIFEDIISDLEKTGDNLSEKYLKEDEISEEDIKKTAEKYTPEGQEINKYGDTVKNINTRANQYVEAEERQLKEEAKLNETPQIDKLDLLSDEVGETVKASKEQDKKKNKVSYRNYLVLFVIITSLTACFTFSKYISTVSDSNSAVVAKFDVSIESNKPDLVFDRIDQYTYITYTIRNNSEVVVDVDVSLSGLEGLSFELDGEPNLTQKSFRTIGIGENRTFILKVASRETSAGINTIAIQYNYKQSD
ncbi:MAG: hypothetical protein PUD72_05475 [Oscillospiraceae bacterium]|nr:hypothetical protein [Oscillospiraceae bacterium]